MRTIANTIADLGKGTLEIVSDWMDQDIELDWVKEFVEKSDRTYMPKQEGIQLKLGNIVKKIFQGGK